MTHHDAEPGCTEWPEDGPPHGASPSSRVFGLITGHFGDTSEVLGMSDEFAGLSASDGLNGKPVAEMKPEEVKVAIEVGELFVRLAQLRLHELHQRLGNIAGSS